MCDVFVYISIKHTPSDIYSAQSGLSFITAANQTLVYEDRITWSLEIDGKHSPKMDIHPYERQAATFVMFDFANNRYIVIASEAAYKPARVHLAPHAYEVLLKVVAKDARQSTWMLKIDPSNNANPVSEPRSINEEEYEATLEKFRTNYYQ
ncbi:MAG TPA: hypothetical protein VEW28_02185 [Candidatus Kapabacteria bacterium]|nr:hypothetical protein [Candidatus Kapabacteria bacterium]